MINEDIDILSLDNKIKLHFESEVQKYKRYNERLLCIENILKIENLRPKILLDLLMDKKYLEKKLVNLSNLDLYSIETSDIIHRYLTIINTPLNIEVALTSQKPTEINNLVLKRRETVQEFIKVAKSYLTEPLLKSLQLIGNFGKEDLLNSIPVVCTCGNDKDFYKDG